MDHFLVGSIAISYSIVCLRKKKNPRNTVSLFSRIQYECRNAYVGLGTKTQHSLVFVQHICVEHAILPLYQMFNSLSPSNLCELVSSIDMLFKYKQTNTLTDISRRLTQNMTNRFTT